MEAKVRGKIELAEFPGIHHLFKGATIREASNGIVTEIVALRYLEEIPGIPKLLKPVFQFQGAVGFVREFIEGEVALKCTQLLGNSKLLIRFAYAVMNVLDRIHRKRLIHGDISPLNIIVRKLDPMEIAVIDFEFAQMIGKEFTPPENIAFAIRQGEYKAAPFVDLYALVTSISALLCANKMESLGVRAFKDEMTPDFFIPFLPDDWRSFLGPMIQNHRHPSLLSVQALMEALHLTKGEKQLSSLKTRGFKVLPKAPFFSNNFFEAPLPFPQAPNGYK